MSNQTVQPSSPKSFENVEDLYTSYSKIAYAFALKILHNPVMAEDAVHDAFLRYYRSPQRFDPARGQFVTWLLTVLRNICFDQFRKINRQNEVSSQSEDLSDNLDNLADSALSVEEEVWLKLQRSNIQAALKAIPADQARLLSAVDKAIQLSRANTAFLLPRLLYVEDNKSLIQVLSLMLDGEARVFSVTTLLEAKARLSKERFDLIMLDVGLPDGSGLELIAFVKNLSKPTIPILIYTSHHVNPAISREVDGVLIKSRVSNQEIIETFRSLVGDHSFPGANNNLGV